MSLALGSERTGRESLALLRLKITRIGGDSVFAIPATRSFKHIRASTFTAYLHTTGELTGASQFPLYPTFSLDHHASSRATSKTLTRTQTVRLLLRQPYSPLLRRLLRGIIFAQHGRMKSLATGPQSRATQQLHSNSNHRYFDSNLSKELLEKPQPMYFGEVFDENGIEEEPCTLKIKTGLDSTKRARMIDFLKEYQEVFTWSYADMPGLDPSIVRHFLPLDTEKFPPKRQHLR
ncbi:hypothetical protein CRG98_027010 [Punica granatum]|uniref:Uncharacterized protein n=1 Tax=Punica granatum TaxID=22663 RepID=A0A2I0J8K0_PUNGR|nr:hypothetical protein CRG98_027010 [Punica granatum]